MNADSQTNFIVHCEACHHEWVGAVLPLTVEKFAEAARANGRACPECSHRKVLCGPAPTEKAA